MSDVRGIQHELAYEAMAGGQIDIMDIYTTDPQIEKLSLVLLDDDLAFFPRYDAVLLYRLDLEQRAPAALAELRRLEGKIDEKLMTRANAAVALEKASTERAAQRRCFATPSTRSRPPTRSLAGLSLASGTTFCVTSSSSAHR